MVDPEETVCRLLADDGDRRRIPRDLIGVHGVGGITNDDDQRVHLGCLPKIPAT
jgi:hypothetical protein